MNSENNKNIILKNLKYGKENAITKTQLIRLTELDERTIRHIIAELQKNGNAICSTSSSAGYYFPKTIEEAEHAINEKKKRAKKCFNGIKPLTKFIQEQTQTKISDYDV